MRNLSSDRRGDQAGGPSGAHRQQRGRRPMSAETPLDVTDDRHDAPEIERYELTAPPSYRFEVARRDFMRIFAAMGGGLLIVTAVPRAGAQESGRGAQNRSVPREIEGWLHIDEKGHVTGYTGKTEIGQ